MRLGACIERTCILAFLQKQGNHVIDLHALGAFRNEDLAEAALIHRLYLHGRFVGFDLCDDIAGFYVVTFFFQPAGDIAFGHGRRQRGHQDFDGHRECLPSGLVTCLFSRRDDGFGLR